MSNGTDWITTRITEAKDATEAESDQHLLTKTVLIRMDELLKGQLSERQLSETELRAIAKELLAGMIPPRPLVEPTQ